MKQKKLLNKLLLVVIAAFMAGSLPTAADDEIEEGWYYIKTKCYYNGGLKLDTDPLTGMTVQNGRLTWEAFENSEPAFIFKLEKAEDPDANSSYAYNANKFYLYNLGDESWYAGLSRSSGMDKDMAFFKQDRSLRKYMTFENDGSGGYYIRSQIQPALYSNDDNPEGTNKNQVFTLCATNAKLKYYAAWRYRGFDRVAPSTLNVWTLEKVPEKELNTARMKTTLRHANNLFNDNVLYTVGEEKLITNGTSTARDSTVEYYSGLGSQLYCPHYNNGWWKDHGQLFKLLDGNITTIFMSREGSDNKKMSEIPVIPNFIQVDLSSDDQNGKQVQGVQLQLCVRGGNNRSVGSTLFPTDITIYGTNDASNAETGFQSISTIATKTYWHKIGDYNFKPFLKETNDYYGQTSPKPTIVDFQPDNTYENKYIVFPDGQKYRFLRFYVNNTTVNYENRRMFEISELQLYELSNISATHGLLNDIETLRGLIASGNKEIQEGTEVSNEDLTALETAINNISNRRTVSISEIGYASFVSDVNVTLPDGLTAYYITATDNNKATLTKVAGAGEVLPAGKPVILKGEPKDEPYILTVATGEAGSITETNLLNGTATENQSNPNTTNPTYYTLQNNNGFPVFKKYTGATLKAGYAYLSVTSTSGSPAFLNLSFDAATGIQSAVNSENVNNAKTYDLEGRSVKHPQKGIYIRGGKKVILK